MQCITVAITASQSTKSQARNKQYKKLEPNSISSGCSRIVLYFRAFRVSVLIKTVDHFSMYIVYLQSLHNCEVGFKTPFRLVLIKFIFFVAPEPKPLHIRVPIGNKNDFIRFLIGIAIRETDAITVFVMWITSASDWQKIATKISCMLYTMLCVTDIGCYRMSAGFLGFARFDW